MSYWRTQIKPLLDAETGTMFKQAPIRVSLVFPNRYSVGMASLGFQVIYRMFNNEEGVACERAFLPDDVEQFEKQNQSLPTVESGKDAGDCELFAMSVSFELDLTNIIRTLDLAGLRPLQNRARRHRRHRDDRRPADQFQPLPADSLCRPDRDR